MTGIEIAKTIMDNGYSCEHLGRSRCDSCPICGIGCGCSDYKSPLHKRRIQLIDDYIAKHEKENTMTELEKLEKAIEENRKAGEELKRRFEEYKNREKIVFDDELNWGIIADYGRAVLSVNGLNHNSVEWKSYSNCSTGFIGVFASGQRAIDMALDYGYKVVKLASGPVAVAKFLLGED